MNGIRRQMNGFIADLPSDCQFLPNLKKYIGNEVIRMVVNEKREENEKLVLFPTVDRWNVWGTRKELREYWHREGVKGKREVTHLKGDDVYCKGKKNKEDGEGSGNADGEEVDWSQIFT